MMTQMNRTAWTRKSSMRQVNLVLVSLKLTKEIPG